MSRANSNVRKAFLRKSRRAFSIVESTESKVSLEYLPFGGNTSEEESLTDACSSISTLVEAPKPPTTYENDDSDCSDYETDDSFQEFTLKDWLKLARVLVRKHESPANKSQLVSKYDELQDFFYFFAVEYFNVDQNTSELVSAKRKEFAMMWQGIVGVCDSVFDVLVDLMDEINVDNSFRL